MAVTDSVAALLSDTVRATEMRRWKCGMVHAPPPPRLSRQGDAGGVVMPCALLPPAPSPPPAPTSTAAWQALLVSPCSTAALASPQSAFNSPQRLLVPLSPALQSTANATCSHSSKLSVGLPFPAAAAGATMTAAAAAATATAATAATAADFSTTVAAAAAVQLAATALVVAHSPADDAECAASAASRQQPHTPTVPATPRAPTPPAPAPPTPLAPTPPTPPAPAPLASTPPAPAPAPPAAAPSGPPAAAPSGPPAAAPSGPPAPAPSGPPAAAPQVPGSPAPARTPTAESPAGVRCSGARVKHVDVPYVADASGQQRIGVHLLDTMEVAAAEEGHVLAGFVGWRITHANGLAVRTPADLAAAPQQTSVRLGLEETVGGPAWCRRQGRWWLRRGPLYHWRRRRLHAVTT
eukprot:TRINITY_DN15334_c0_g1_i2.p1 TRINITY_DN15334_c0_g1~~TRINITY_DN15334_c0_g1_i2.p1  ORF type:complete len:428 (+),score=76.38 TRINITY_DN15334_c0_g1_i2:58-1284(+)